MAISTGNRDFNPRLMHKNISTLKARTRKIDYLKCSLPVVALIITLVLVLWPQFRQWHYSHLPKLAQTSSSHHKNNTATYPAYKGVDKNNQPFTLSAEQGMEILANEIELSSPNMEIILNTGARVTLSASSGTYNKTMNNLHLIGNVILTHSHGYSLETSQAWIDCNLGNAYTNDPVWGNGPLGSIQAKGFSLDAQGDKISFKGKAELYLRTKQGLK